MSMNICALDSPYKKDDKESAGSRLEDFRCVVAVSSLFVGSLKELFGDTELRIGYQVTARVVKVLDGKLTLSVREAYLQIQKDAEKIETVARRL